MSNLPMPEPGFTKAETEAFDRGVEDGEHRGMDAENPYCSINEHSLWDAWETGATVGTKNHRA